MKTILATLLLALSGAASANDALLCLAAERAHGPNHPITARLCGLAYVPPQPRRVEPPQPRRDDYGTRPVTTECKRNDSTRVVTCTTY